MRRSVAHSNRTVAAGLDEDELKRATWVSVGVTVWVPLLEAMVGSVEVHDGLPIALDRGDRRLGTAHSVDTGQAAAAPGPPHARS